MAVEKVAVEILRRNLVVAIPFTILGLRLLVRWVAREEPKEVFRSLLTLPLDLMFIAMTLVLAGLGRLAPKFAAHYDSDRDADLAGALLLISLVFLAALLTYFGRALRVVWQKFFAAWQQLRRKMEQPRFKWEGADVSVRGRLLWMVGYWVTIVLLFSGQLLLAVSSLWYILHLMEQNVHKLYFWLTNQLLI